MGTTTTTTDPAIAWLKAYRLERGLSYQALAARMARADCYVPARLLHRAIAAGATPHETNLFKIRNFVTTIRARRKAPPRKGRRRTAAA